MAVKAAATYIGSPCRKAGHTVRFIRGGACAECARAAVNAWHREHPEVVRASRKKWEVANPEKAAARPSRKYENNALRHRANAKRWAASHPGERRAADARWQKANPDKVNAKSMQRHAAKMKRLPSWADREWINHAYAVATEMTTKMGEPFHVDHELPLQGRLVSGLHVYENMRVIPGPENCRKGNLFQPQ